MVGSKLLLQNSIQTINYLTQKIRPDFILDINIIILIRRREDALHRLKLSVDVNKIAVGLR